MMKRHMLIFDSFLDAIRNVVFERRRLTGVDRRVASSHGEIAKMGKVGSASALQLRWTVIPNENASVWSSGGSTVDIMAIKNSLVRKILRVSTLAVLIKATTLRQCVPSCKRARLLRAARIVVNII
jgi:hypothetical protein